MRAGILLGCTFFAVTLTVIAEDIEDPGGFYNPWATRTVGDWVTFEEKCEGKLAYMTRWKVTLLEKRKDSVLLRNETFKNGENVKEESSRPFGAYEGTKLSWDETGKEVLTIDGKEYSCRVLEGVGLNEGESRKCWRAVVGGKELELKRIVSFENKDGDLRRRTSSIRHFSDVQNIAEKKVDCVVRTVVDEVQDTGKSMRTIETTTWETDKVPTGFAKSVTKSMSEGGENIQTITVTEFGSARQE